MSALVIGQLAVGDPSSTRTVYAVVYGLGFIGLMLSVLAFWLIRQTRPERELLAPLERMNDRSWRKQDPVEQRRTLDEVRPAGATPVRPQSAVPELDQEFEKSRPKLATFDDLAAQLRADAARMKAELDALAGIDPSASESDGPVSTQPATEPDADEPDADEPDADEPDAERVALDGVGDEADDDAVEAEQAPDDSSADPTAPRGMAVAVDAHDDGQR